MTDESATDLRRTLLTAPYGSPELLDAVEAMIDAGRASEVDDILDWRENHVDRR